MKKSMAREFTGFSPDAFHFYQELRANNNKQWFDRNRGRYIEHVREPLRSLMNEVGQALKPIFDPFLSPDALEIEPKADKVLARPNRQRPKHGEIYYPQYWGAFYRERLKKKTDAQLSVNIQGDGLRTGFHVGAPAEDQHMRFRRSVLRNPERVYRLLSEVGVRDSFPVERLLENWEPIAIRIKSPEDVYRWMEEGDHRAMHLLAPDDPLIISPSLVDFVVKTLRQVFPFFLLAVVSEPWPLIERYLASPITSPATP